MLLISFKNLRIVYCLLVFSSWIVYKGFFFGTSVWSAYTKHMISHVPRYSLDQKKVSSRSRLGHSKVSSRVIVSDSLANVSVSSRSRELRSRSWSRSRPRRSWAHPWLRYNFIDDFFKSFCSLAGISLSWEVPWHCNISYQTGGVGYCDGLEDFHRKFCRSLRCHWSRGMHLTCSQHCTRVLDQALLLREWQSSKAHYLRSRLRHQLLVPRYRNFERSGQRGLLMSSAPQLVAIYFLPTSYFSTMGHQLFRKRLNSLYATVCFAPLRIYVASVNSTTTTTTTTM